MKSLSTKEKIINILGNLKNTQQNYPPELIQARREMFAKQVAWLCSVEPNGSDLDLSPTPTYNRNHPYTITHE